MRYDLSVPLVDFDGNQISDKDGTGYTLRSVLMRTALFIDSTRPLPSAEQKLEAYALAKRLAQANRYIDVDAEQVVFLKRNAGAMWTPLVLGILADVLERPISLAGAMEEMSQSELNADLYRELFPRKPTADIPSEG